MCGIAGFVDFRKESSREILQGMTLAIQHRGPDGEGHLFLDQNHFQLGFGHRRLSILDLSENGAQPMSFQKLWITFNGEVYNFREIREDLVHLGRSFHTETDTEVILQAFDEWGTSCVHRFIGFFAFAIFDSELQKLYFFRDRVGVKPFFYYWDEEILLFGSELKSILKHPSFKQKLNLNSVAAFLQFGHVPTPNSIYDSIKKLKPGHFSEIDLASSKFVIEEQVYWKVSDFYNRKKLNISLDEAKQEVKKLLQSAFSYRLVSDVPVGVFLSGGYDSTCVAAILQEAQSEAIHTYTISVPSIGLNEAPYAEETAKKLGTIHQTIECSVEDALKIIPELPHFYDEPFADSSAIPTLLLSRHVRKVITVALSADGGDELFAGYNRHDYLMRLGPKINRIPSFLRKGIVGIMNLIPATKIPYFKNTYNFPNRYEKLKHLLRNPSPENMMLQLSRQWDDKQIQELFLSPIKPLENKYTETLNKEYSTPLSTMLNIDYQTYLVDDIMQKVDRATMAASLEGREPFLDHRLIEFIAQLPDDYKYRQGIKKFLLREIVHDYIPKENLDRPKMGFAIPIEKWMCNELRSLVEHCFDPKKIEQQGIFKLAPVQKLKDDFFGGKMELGFKVWYFVSFQLWHDKYLSS